MANQLLVDIVKLFSGKDKVENFSSGFGFELPESIHPIFLNMYKQQLETDFGLFDVIQNLKYKYFNPKIGMNITDKSLNPIVFIPGLGTTDITARWNKSSSKNVKTVNGTEFQESERWSCRQTQDQWTDMWFPGDNSNKRVSQYCWEDNIKVLYNKNNNTVTNPEGVETTIKGFGTTSFQPNSYLNTWLSAVKALGYKEGFNLFGAGYDFRKICSADEMGDYVNSLKQIIERSVRATGKRVMLVGHSLGSNIANYFLVNQPKAWKDAYIKSFVTFSGAFGGCPKALRTMLSGVDVTNKPERQLLRNVTRNFTGLQWMLPVPGVYGDIPLVHYRSVSYSAKDIPELLGMVSDSALEIYMNVVVPVQMASLVAPGVPVYTFSGTNLMTESSYKYTNSLTDDPIKNHPYYQMDQAFANNYDYPQEFNGDGTIPHLALQYPLSWTSHQKEPIVYRFYNRVEHKDILNTEQPVKDFIAIIKQS